MRVFRFSAVMDWRVPRCGWARRSGPAWASSSPTSTSGRPNLVTRGFVLTPTAVVSRLDQYFPHYFSWKLPPKHMPLEKLCFLMKWWLMIEKWLSKDNNIWSCESECIEWLNDLSIVVISDTSTLTFGQHCMASLRGDTAPPQPKCHH